MYQELSSVFSGSKENARAVEALGKIWSHIEGNMESVAVQLYRTMFKSKPDLFTVFPFYTDEWNKIVYSDYTGNYSDQPPASWFLVCRWDILLVLIFW